MFQNTTCLVTNVLFHCVSLYLVNNTNTIQRVRLNWIPDKKKSSRIKKIILHQCGIHGSVPLPMIYRREKQDGLLPKMGPKEYRRTIGRPRKTHRNKGVFCC